MSVIYYLLKNKMMKIDTMIETGNSLLCYGNLTMELVVFSHIKNVDVTPFKGLLIVNACLLNDFLIERNIA